MRSVAYALMTLTAGVLMASPASAGCYGGPCGDGYRGDGYGYQSAPPTTYYNSGPAYDNGYGGERVYSSGPIESYTVRPPDYGVKYTVPSYDEGYDSYGHYDRPYRSYGYGGGYYERPYRSYSYNGGYGYDRPYYRPYRSYYGYGGGSGYYGYDRPYYRSYGYGYGGGYGRGRGGGPEAGEGACRLPRLHRSVLSCSCGLRARERCRSCWNCGKTEKGDATNPAASLGKAAQTYHNTRARLKQKSLRIPRVSRVFGRLRRRQRRRSKCTIARGRCSASKRSSSGRSQRSPCTKRCLVSPRSAVRFSRLPA